MGRVQPSGRAGPATYYYPYRAPLAPARGAERVSPAVRGGSGIVLRAGTFGGPGWRGRMACGPCPWWWARGSRAGAGRAHCTAN